LQSLTTKILESSMNVPRKWCDGNFVSTVRVFCFSVLLTWLFRFTFLFSRRDVWRCWAVWWGPSMVSWVGMQVPSKAAAESHVSGSHSWCTATSSPEFASGTFVCSVCTHSRWLSEFLNPLYEVGSTKEGVHRSFLQECDSHMGVSCLKIQKLVPWTHLFFPFPSPLKLD
jgi:hypothetical protein